MSFYRHSHDDGYYESPYPAPRRFYEECPPPPPVEEAYVYEERRPIYRENAYERPAEHFHDGYGCQDQRKNFQRNERLGELGAVAAGAFALFENHKAKTDVENAQKHKQEAQVAEVAALGSGGYALYEHHEKKKYGF